MAEIDQLKIEIIDSSDQAVKGIDALIHTLERLKTISKGGVGLTATSNQLKRLSDTVKEISVPNEKLKSIVDAIKPLTTIGKASGLNSTINSLRKLPEVTSSLESIDMDRFASQINKVTAALQPLGAEMQKISNGFNAFPTKIQKIITQNNRLSASNRKTGSSFSIFGNGLGATMAKLGFYYYALKRVGGVLAGWINSSNEYIENINLFTVSMGKYAQEAMTYAKAVNEAMGIDLSEFIRNQGVFMQIATGFGVVEQQAYNMSRGLTQVSYDIASFFNIPIEDAFTKVQSGISGELEPLRRLGYALDQATLQQIALRYGIETSVTKMNQAQKSYLRYIAIMEQSTKAAGDMARTLITPANASRILSQQIEQLSRAVGNMFIPIMIKVIPYVQAFVMVLTQAAQAVANFLGFELPVIDYSSVSGLSSAVGDIDDGLSDATGTAKKFKNVLAGFDQLNILQSAKDASGGIVSDLTTTSGLGIDLSQFDYDFLGEAENQAKKIFDNITEKIDEFRTKLEPFEPLLSGILDAFLLTFGFKWVSGAVTKFSKIGAISTGLGALKGALAGAATSFAIAHSPLLALGTGFSMLWSSFKVFVQGLSPFTKVALAAIGMYTEFKVTKEVVKDLALKNMDLGTALMNLLPIVALVETVLGVAFGPTGVIIGAIAIAAGAIAGFNEAQNILQEEWIAATFFDGVGVSLDELRTKFEASTREIDLQNDQIITWSEQLKQGRDDIDNAALSIQTLSATIGREGAVSKSEIEAIKGQFSKLYESIKTNMELSDSVIQTALVGALKRATPEIATQIDLLIGEYMRFVRETSGRSTELELLINNSYDNLVGKVAGSPEYNAIMTEINKYYTELGVLSGTMTDAAWNWKSTVEDFNTHKINFGTVDGDIKKSVENFKTDLSELTSAGSNALKDIETSYSATMKEIQNKIDYASQYGSQEDVKILLSIQDAIKRDYDNQRSGVQSQLDSIFDDVQLSMILSIEEMKNQATLEWNNLNWFEKIWNGGSEAAYVSKALMNYQKNIVTPVEDSIKTHMADLGIEGSTWASDAMADVMESLFNYDFASSGNMVISYQNSISDAIKTSLDAVALSGKADAVKTGSYINAGLSEGISGSINKVDESIIKTANSAINSWKMTTETHSPSQIFTNFGKFITDGLVNGIDSGANGVVLSIQKVANSIINEMSRAVTSIASSVSNILSSVESAKSAVESLNNININTPTIPTYKKNSYSPSIGAYATGGIPKTGELFVANEAGVEMVGSMGGKPTVANNEQIVEGITRGVYEAVTMAMASMSKLNQSSDNDKEFVLVVDDVVFGRVVGKSINNAQRQSGTTIVTV